MWEVSTPRLTCAGVVRLPCVHAAVVLCSCSQGRHCSLTLVRPYIRKPVFPSSGASLFRCARVPLVLYVPVPVSPCSRNPVWLCPLAPLTTDAGLPLCRWSTASVFRGWWDYGRTCSRGALPCFLLTDVQEDGGEDGVRFREGLDKGVVGVGLGCENHLVFLWGWNVGQVLLL